MKKIFKRKSVETEAQVEPNMAVSIDKMQQQLILLEKKIDTLLSQSSQRPPSAGRDFSKPFRRFDNRQRFGGKRDNNYQERSFTKAVCADCKAECEIPFKPTGDRPVYCKDCFAKHREGTRPFNAKFEHAPRKKNRRPGGKQK